MTVAITPERLNRTMQLLQLHVQKGWRCPTNWEIALWIGMGTQKFQPADRMRGVRSNSPEAGSTMLAALELLGLVKVESRGRHRRVIIVATGDVLEPVVHKVSYPSADECEVACDLREEREFQ